LTFSGLIFDPPYPTTNPETTNPDFLRFFDQLEHFLLFFAIRNSVLISESIFTLAQISKKMCQITHQSTIHLRKKFSVE
jgi:hypothetical protein